MTPETPVHPDRRFDAVVFEWLSLVVDLNGQALNTKVNGEPGLDHLTIGFGPRFVIGPVGLEVGAVIPFAGTERNLASFALRAAYRF